MNVRRCRRLAQLVVFQIFLLNVKGERRLIGATETVWGLAGQDSVLPCGLESKEDITGQGVEWARSDLTPKYVFIYQGYKTNNDHLHPSFKGRTSMSFDRLKKGNMSLIITDLRFNDSGTYKCILPSVKTMISAEVRLELGLVSEPQILHPVSLVEKLTLTCEAKDWNPKPEVEWRDSEGQTVFRDPNGTKENENGYYDIHSTFIGDIKLSEYYVCIIRQKETDHTSKTTYIVPGDVVRLYVTTIWVVSIMAAALLAAILEAAVIVYTCYQKKKLTKEINLLKKGIEGPKSSRSSSSNSSTELKALPPSPGEGPFTISYTPKGQSRKEASEGNTSEDAKIRDMKE